MSSEKAFRVPKTAELVANSLRDKILRGDVSHGHALPSENDLAQEYSISRPTLREALRILESEGLISVQRGVHGGPRVHQPDPRLAALHFGRVLRYRKTTLSDLFTARLVIEPTCARLLAEQGKKSAVKALNAILQESRGLLHDEEAFAKASIRFHNSIIELTGNAPLILLMGTLSHIYELHLSSDEVSRAIHGFDPESMKRDLDTQVKLIAAIEAKDGDGAERIARQSLTLIDKQLRKVHDGSRVIDV